MLKKSRILRENGHLMLRNKRTELCFIGLARRENGNIGGVCFDTRVEETDSAVLTYIA